MNTMTIDQLKQASIQAVAVLDAEKARLAAAGVKSQQRYEMLKPLKEYADAVYREYKHAADRYIVRELDKIIASQTPAERAEGLRRARSVV